MRYVSQNLDDTHKIAQNFLGTLEGGPQATIIALKGDLGSGKTAFVQEVGKILRVADNIHSPTFVIEKIYAIDWKNFKRLIHIDAYRLEKNSELLHLGWEGIIKEPENLIMIEWPENVSNLIPRSDKQVSFKFIDETAHEITYDN